MSEFRNKLLAGLGLEDNAQVEVNFNIEKESDSSIEESDSASNLDSEVNTEDSEKAQEEVQNLEAAQDSLESLKIALEESMYKGGMTNADKQSYDLTMRAILGKGYDKLNSVSLESFSSDRLNATHLTLVKHNDIQNKLRVSMEESKGISNSVSTLIKNVKTYIQTRLSYVKKIESIEQRANAAKNEKSPTSTLTVNNSKSIKLHRLTTVPMNSEKDVINEVTKFVNTLKAIKRDTAEERDVRLRYKKVFGTMPIYNDVMKKGKSSIMGLEFSKSNDGLINVTNSVYKDSKSIPVLTPKAILIVCNQIKELLNDDWSSNSLSKLVSSKPTKPVENLYSNLNTITSARIGVIKELINYMEVCLVKRTAYEAVE